MEINVRKTRKECIEAINASLKKEDIKGILEDFDKKYEDIDKYQEKYIFWKDYENIFKKSSIWQKLFGALCILIAFTIGAAIVYASVFKGKTTLPLILTYTVEAILLIVSGSFWIYYSSKVQEFFARNKEYDELTTMSFLYMVTGELIKTRYNKDIVDNVYKDIYTVMNYIKENDPKTYKGIEVAFDKTNTDLWKYTKKQEG